MFSDGADFCFHEKNKPIRTGLIAAAVTVVLMSIALGVVCGVKHQNPKQIANDMIVKIAAWMVQHVAAATFALLVSTPMVVGFFASNAHVARNKVHEKIEERRERRYRLESLPEYGSRSMMYFEDC